MRLLWIAAFSTLFASLDAGAEGAAEAPSEGHPSRSMPARPDNPKAWDLGPLGRQAAELEQAYAKLGELVRLPPRLLDNDGEHPLVLPPDMLKHSETCLTIATLAAPNLSFLLLFSKSSDDPSHRAWPVPSAAGAAEVTRCGARKDLLDGLGVKLRSRRGVFEFFVLESEHPPPPISELLPGRNPGPSLASPQVGRRPWLAPLKTRLAAIEARNRKTGAVSIHTSGLNTDESGRGSSVVHLSPGCHRLQLLAEADPSAPPDLDAQLFTLTQAEQLTADDEHSSQVTLEHCVGRNERLRLDFSGAVPQSEVTLVHSNWDIPEAFPIGWGALARSRLALAAWKDDLRPFTGAPTFSSLGVRGSTRLALSLDPTACYVGVLAPIRGDASNLALAVATGTSTSEAHAENNKGVSLSFCAEGAELADLEVQGVGAGVAWILGIWPMGARP